MPPLCRARRHGPDCPQLEACRASRNPQLAAIVTIALETGLRRSELLGLTWDRVDLSRGVIRLEVTKSGRRREVPMRQAVHDVLVALAQPAACGGSVGSARPSMMQGVASKF